MFKKPLLCLAPFFVALVAGCNNSNPSESPASKTTKTTPTKLTTSEELAKYCRVCVLDKNEKMEEFLPTRLDVKTNGQTYKFCSEPCRKSFDANKKRYLMSETTAKTS